MKFSEFIIFLWHRIYLFFYLGKVHFFRNLFSSLGLFLTLCVVIILLGLLRPIREALLLKAQKSLPTEMLRLTKVPKTEKNILFPFLQAKRDMILGFVEKDIQKIANFPGVKKIYVSQILQKPAMATIDHPLIEKLGLHFYFDVLFQGVQKEFVGKYLQCMKDFQIAKEKTAQGQTISVLPLVVPETFAEIAYTYGMIFGVAELNPKDFIGLRLKIRLGESTLGIRTPKKSLVIGKICGFVPEGIVTVLGVPLNFVKEEHRQLEQKNALNSYDQLFVVFQNTLALEEFKKMAAKEGWQLPAQEKKYAELFRILDKLDYLFWGIAFILLLLSILAMANAFALLAVEKKFEFGLYLVFGASPIFLWTLIFLEGAFWGFFHSSTSLWLSEKIFETIKPYLGQLPFFIDLNFSLETNLKLSLSAQEKTLLIFGSSLIGGISSLVPTIFLIGKKTLDLVRKD